MKVLALTHAHLNIAGLSPVSCERADSIAETWCKEMKWQVDVLHTSQTKWRGIWPDGKGMAVNILSVSAPESLMMPDAVPMFLNTAKKFIQTLEYGKLFSLLKNRISKNLQRVLAEKGIVLSYELALARRWGEYLLTIKEITPKKYDFIFVSVGYGDEYLLETALIISQKLKVPMVVDFRDLWSDHHDPERFTNGQRKNIKKNESRLLKTTILLSVPQKPMASFLEWTNIPVHFTSHSAYIESNWEDGEIITDEFRMLYAGKLYPESPGLEMLMQLIQKLAKEDLGRPLICHFYTDEGSILGDLAIVHGIEKYIAIHNWITPKAIWKEMRSAHLLLTFDTGISMPLIMTKSYQYAYTGRPILALYNKDNESYTEFFRLYDAGRIFYDTQKAMQWVKEMILEETQYKMLPALKKIPLRNEIAEELGEKIIEILAYKKIKYEHIF